MQKDCREDAQGQSVFLVCGMFRQSTNDSNAKIALEIANDVGYKGVREVKHTKKASSHSFLLLEGASVKP